MAGYSLTSLAKKLGIKAHFKIKLFNAPDYYFDLFNDLPEVEITGNKSIRKDFIHIFIKKRAELEPAIQTAKQEIVSNGIIWISWYKKSSKIPTDVTEDLIRNTALENGLVDVKICAVDDVWSGLKLVIPVKDRHRYT